MKMNDNSIDLSVVIVNWNTKELLSQCLRSVYETIHDCSFEVFVVDNGSYDGSPQMVREKFPEVHLIENGENLGFAKANNIAMQLCQGRYLLLLNSDAALTQNAIAILLKAAGEHPNAGILGPTLIFPDGRIQRGYGGLPTLKSELVSLVGLDKLLKNRKAAGPGEDVVPAGFVDGACQVVRRSSLDQIGLFDERFFFFSEEVDLCHRAHLGGWQVLHVPAARVIHVGGGSTVSSAARTLQLYRAKLQYFDKHYGSNARRRLLVAMRVTSWIKSKVYASTARVRRGQAVKDYIWQVVYAGLRT